MLYQPYFICLGVDTSKYIQLGQDLFSKQNEQLVAFRDGDFVTPEYTYYGGVLYSNSTGMAIPSPSASLQKQVDEWKAKVDKQLSVSDQINNGDLLRFYAKSGLKEVDPDNYDYKNSLQKLVPKKKNSVPIQRVSSQKWWEIDRRFVSYEDL